MLDAGDTEERSRVRGNSILSYLMCNAVGTQPSGQPHHRILAVKTFILSGNLKSRSATEKTSAPVFTWQDMIRNEALEQRLGPASSHTQLLDPCCQIRYLRGINLALCLALTWHLLERPKKILYILHLG